MQHVAMCVIAKVQHVAHVAMNGGLSILGNIFCVTTIKVFKEGVKEYIKQYSIHG